MMRRVSEHRLGMLTIRGGSKVVFNTERWRYWASICMHFFFSQKSDLNIYLQMAAFIWNQIFLLNETTEPQGFSFNNALL